MGELATRRLGRTAVEVTTLGLGGAALGNLYAPLHEDDATATVEAALASGVRFFDTAPYYGYGLSETRFGRALKGLPRESYVLSTKVGRVLVPREEPRNDQGFVDALPAEAVFDYGYDGVMLSFEASCARLGVDRVDVVLIHDVGSISHGDAHPAQLDRALTGGMRALESLRSAGRIAAIGLGVNEWEVCLEALDRADFDCFLLAGRYTLLEQGALDVFLPACAARGISVIVGGPYNSGLLTGEPRAGAMYDYANAAPDVIERAHAIYRVCRDHGVPLESAAIQFPLAHRAVACVIPGARSPAEAIANAAFLAAPIPAALWRDLAGEGLLRPDAPTPRSAT